MSPTCRNLSPARSVLVILLMLIVARVGEAAVKFHLHREGTDPDQRYLDAIGRLGDHQVTDFEDPSLGGLNAPLSSLQVGDINLNFAAYWNGPYVPTIETSVEYNVPGKVSGLALTCGSVLNISTQPGSPARVIGMWIFDDTRRWDSVFLIEVWETSGATYQAILANDTPLNSHGHEIEGFVFAVSDVGIAAMRITAVNPITLQPQPDLFEIDHLTTAGPRVPDVLPPGEDLDPRNPPDESGRDGCASSWHRREPWIAEERDRCVRRQPKCRQEQRPAAGPSCYRSRR